VGVLQDPAGSGKSLSAGGSGSGMRIRAVLHFSSKSPFLAILGPDRFAVFAKTEMG
jgi:hypothetical protein